MTDTIRRRIRTVPHTILNISFFFAITNSLRKYRRNSTNDKIALIISQQKEGKFGTKSTQMTTYLLHVTIAEAIQELSEILVQRNYELTLHNQDRSMIVAYTRQESLRMVQINIYSINNYLEVNVHSTCFSKGTSLLTNDIDEEELIIRELENSFAGNSNTFRLTPEDYVFSFI
jgi:hypothetical protein